MNEPKLIHGIDERDYQTLAQLDRADTEAWEAEHPPCPGCGERIRLCDDCGLGADCCCECEDEPMRIPCCFCGKPTTWDTTYGDLCASCCRADNE